MKISLKYFLSKKRSVIFAWLISYLSVLLIPILMIGIAYFYSGRIVKEQIAENNVNLLKQIRQVVDNQMLDVRKLYLNIAWNTRVKGMMLDDGTSGNSIKYLAYEAVQDFKKYKVANSFIDDFYVYLRNINIVLTPNSAYDPDLLYTGEEKQKWLNIINGHKVRECRAVEITSYSGVPVNTIGYIQKLPLEDPYLNLGTIVVLLDEKRLRDTISNVSKIDRSEVMIIDENDNILISSQIYNFSGSGVYSRMSGGHGLIYDTFNGERVAISYIESEVMGWKYVVLMPQKVLMEKADHFIRLMVASILACLLLGGFAAYAFLIKNYKMVNSLVMSIANKTGVSIKNERNEYSFIYETFNNIFDEKRKTDIKLRQQHFIIWSDFLAKLLKGRISSPFTVENTLSTYNIHFDGEAFAVLIFFAEEIDEAFESNDEDEADDKHKLVNFIVRNCLEEVANRKLLGLVAEVDESLVCLVNCRDTDEKTREEVYGIGSEVKDFVESNFSIYLSVSISNIHRSLVNIPVCYRQAKEAMEQRLVSGSGKILRYQELCHEHQNFFYPLDIEQKLINCVKAGMYNDAKKILNEVFDRNLSKGKMPIALVRCFIIDIVNTIIKLIDGINLGDSMPGAEKITDNIMKCSTVSDMRVEIDAVLKHLCNTAEANKKSHNNELTEEIIQYIKNNYADESLSISSIADNFYMNSSYISRFFKEQTGEAILDFINRVRLEKAKYYLKYEKMNLVEVAKNVGYYDSRAIIRAFKKYEGITPGKYKEMA